MYIKMTRLLLAHCGWLTGKPEVMPPGWQIAPDKRACIDWSGQLPGGRQPETNRLSPDKRGNRTSANHVRLFD